MKNPGVKTLMNGGPPNLPSAEFTTGVYYYPGQPITCGDVPIWKAFKKLQLLGLVAQNGSKTTGDHEKCMTR